MMGLVLALLLRPERREGLECTPPLLTTYDAALNVPGPAQFRDNR